MRPIAPRNRPLLVSLWAPWCSPCVEELKGFSAHAAKLRDADVDIVAINIVAINVDSLESSADTSAEKRILRDTGFPLASARATRSLLTGLNVLRDTIIDKPSPLGLPTSFLIDAQNRLVIIYLGPVSAQEVLDDLPLKRAMTAYATLRQLERGSGQPSRTLRNRSIRPSLGDALTQANWMRQFGILGKSRCKMLARSTFWQPRSPKPMHGNKLRCGSGVPSKVRGHRGARP